MTDLTSEQKATVRELAELYFEPLSQFREHTPDATKTAVREAWTAWREEAGIDNAQADLASIGTLLPVITFLETVSAEEAKEIGYLMLLSLLDNNLSK